MNPIGCNSQQLSDILLFCGFDHIDITDTKKVFFVKIDAKAYFIS